MHVRCPHCQNPIELVGDSELNDVTCPSCGSHFNLATDETASYRPSMEAIGHFQLVERLGMGHFGTVWKAHDTELDRVVAIKIPRQEQLDAKQTEQFLREARAAAQLRHANIVSVHEVGRHDGSVYIVSDFVQGLTLADWLTGQRPTIREAVELCVKIAEALEHAHSAGVVHRDLKPSNIMIDGSGGPHLMDFGLAKRDAGEITMTVEGHVLGTPAYMSPEQARGEAHQADRRSDVYSLGVILFELLTGERPFRGNTRMLLHQVIYDEAPSPRKLNGNIPKDLETICLKCLEKDLGRRYPTAAAYSADLQRFLRQEPISARPISRIERSWRWCRQEPAIASLSLAVLVTLIAGVTVSVIFAEKERRHANSESAARRDEKIQREEAEKQTRIAQQSLHQSVRTAVDAAQNSHGDTRAAMVSILKSLPRDMVLDELKSRFSDAELHRKLGLAFALAEYGEPDAPYLCSQISHSAPEEVDNFVATFCHARDASLDAIQAFAKETESKPDWRLKVRLAVVTLHLGDDGLAADMCRIKDRPDPVQRTIFIDEFPVWHGDLERLAANCRNLSDPALRSAICLAIGSLPSNRLAVAETDAWKPLFAEWFQSASDNATHSATAWALRQWNNEIAVTITTRTPDDHSVKFVNTLGMTMLKIQPGHFTRTDDRPGGAAQNQTVKLSRAFFLGDREVSVDQFQRFIDDPACPKSEKPADWPQGDGGPKGSHPQSGVNWYDAILFCNWLSRREGLVACYERTGKKEKERYLNIEREFDEWRLVMSGTGYRLPTEAEWEFACRAGTTTDFASGTDADLLRKYAVYATGNIGGAATCGSKLPNGWGLFDMHGNTLEWCYDWHGLYVDGDVTDPTGPSDGGVGTATRVLRGGNWGWPAVSCRSGSRFRNLPSFRRNSLGFRAALSSVQRVK